jgi:peptide/nickel transport system permease protein
LFFKKQHKNFESTSLSQITWHRLKKNKLAMTGLSIIIFCSVISILGYLITPDNTPYCNNQKPELHIKAPGFIAHILKAHPAEISSNQSWISVMCFGKQEQFQSVVFEKYWFDGCNIFVEEYTGSKPNLGDVSSFNLAEVLYPLQKKGAIQFDSIKQEISFFKSGESFSTKEKISSLQEKIKKENIVEQKYLLGTDLLGRDLLSRLLLGSRISLTVGLISVIISIFIGIFLGAIAGYYRGKIDAFIMWLINVVWSIPTLLLVIAITLVLGKGIVQVFIAVGLTMWVEVARIVRGQVLSIREKEFVEAGRALGYSNARIIFNHILPNVLGPVVVVAAGNFASAILMEAGLSFLGLGAQPPIPSWGEMTNAHHGYILMDKAYLAFIPGCSIMILVLAFMLLGNGLRDAMDTRTSNDKPF